MSDAPLGSLGRYRLVRQLGRGGMAEVFEARAEGAAGVTKSLCVKRILPAFAGDRRFVRMFVSEARVAMALDHGNIAQVFDFGQEGADLYLAMELVDGKSLSQVHRRLRAQGLRFPVPLALQIVREVCKALHHAHERTDERGRRLGIVHRDVSPQNILLAYDGQVKLVDFGIARASSAASTGGLVGKVPYMAPEQARGEDVDRRADVFGAGAVLFELLSGRTPVPADLDPAVYAISEPSIPSLSEVAPGIDSVLAALVDRAVSAERGARYASALAFQQALASYVERRRLRTTEDDVGRLTRYLFAATLAEAGQSADIPEDYGASLTQWRDSTAEAPTVGNPLLWVVLGSAAVLAVAVGVFVATSRGADAWDVHVRSQPPGARILVDGGDTGLVTDAVLEDLERGRIHRITLEHPDFASATRNLIPGQEEVTVGLETEAQAAASPSEGEAAGGPRWPVPSPAAPPRPALDVTRDEQGGWLAHLDRDRATVSPRGVQGLWLDLIPEQAYVIETDGSLMMTLGREMTTVAWLAVDDEGALLGGGLVATGVPHAVPEGARQVGLMSIRARGACAITAGRMSVSLRSKGRPIASRSLDIHRHCISIDEQTEASLRGLPNDRGHRIVYEGPPDGPLLLLVGASTTPRSLTRPHDEALAALWPGESTALNFVEDIYLIGVGKPDPDASPATIRVESGPEGRALSRER